MSAALSLSRPRLVLAAVLGLASSLPAVAARLPADLAGTWELSLDRLGTSCRVMLRPQQSDKGDYFLGMPTACRHAMPGVASAGRWAMPDATHITFDDPTGAALMAFVASGDGFAAAVGDGTYVLKPVSSTGRSMVGVDDLDARPETRTMVAQPIAKRSHAEVVEREKPSDLAGRYAVLREKRDTGCMVTLDDTSRVAGGNRAQLAPGCRDQGIVIFDPSAWQLVKGDLVLTARAGHKTKLDKVGEGLWAKDAKDGGKPLGLKKL